MKMNLKKKMIKRKNKRLRDVIINIKQKAHREVIKEEEHLIE